MMGFPLIARELRVEAQRPFNYWLRVIAAGLVIVLLAAMLVDGARVSTEPGALLFSYLHAGLFLGIWTFVPLLTADCLSQEKREGTLGLLFLTPLTPQRIVAAKAVIHTLRAVVFLLAMAPPLVLPFLLGGIAGSEAIISLSLNLAAVFVALSAGLFASAWCQSLVRSVALSILLSFVLSALFAYTFACGFFTFVTDQLYFSTSPAGATAVGFLYLTGTGALWNEVSSKLSPGQQQAWVWLAIQMLGLGMLVMLLAIGICGRRLRRDWRVDPPGLPRLRLTRTFFVPRFWMPLMRRHMNRLLDRNPIGWLQEYSWHARAQKWGWLGLFGVADAWIVNEQIEGNGRWRDLLTYQFYMGVALLGGVAASAVASFRRERQNGVLELLLVSPLTTRQLISGRVFGIWGQFFPAALLLFVVWWKVLSMGGSFRWMPDFKWFVLVAFVTLPVVGLWCSLVHRSFMVCWLAACAAGIAFPYFASRWAADFLRPWLMADIAFFCVGTLLQGAVAWLAWTRLRRSLALRTFALN